MANVQIDQALWPEGVVRGSFTTFLVWVAFWGLVFLTGIVAAGVVFGVGMGVTGLNNVYAFGLYIIFDLAVIALGAGAFFSGLLKYIVKIDQLKHIINLTVIVGFFCYSGALLILTMELGQPLRSWFGYWHPNVHSMLTEVIFCITCYMGVLAIEYLPLVLEQKQLNQNKFLHYFAHNMHIAMPLFAGIGAFLSTFHQGSLGGMYGVMFARPFSYRDGFFIWPWTFFLFVLSAVGSGPCFTTLICAGMEKITGRQLVDYKVKMLMGKIAGTMLSIYMFFKLLDTYHWIAHLLPATGMTYAQMWAGVSCGSWLLWAELLCGLVAAGMLICPSMRAKPNTFYLACILNVIGVSLNRYNINIPALGSPVMPFETYQFYSPTFYEWAPAFMVIAYGIILLSISYRYLPVFPQEVELNRAK